MVNWEELFLFELIVMRMTGFVLFNPIWGRGSVPGMVKAGFVLVLSVFTYGVADAPAVEVPSQLLVLSVLLMMELGIGLTLSVVIRLFLSVVQLGGEIIDTQMGMTMAQIYDASSQNNMTVSASLLNILFILTFFAENGHYTLMRILVTSGEVLPYGAATFGPEVASHVVEIFLSCMILAVKLALPILAAELLGEIGMGILMKAIPQINAFVINMELKVIIGLVLLFFFLTPIHEFLLGAEVQMLNQLSAVLGTIAGNN
ncbi:MAG: flagellar biosynthetic protein FliR [Lawsonibacter sp.]|jgi:flagellar biosynthetic protein FliR